MCINKKENNNLKINIIRTILVLLLIGTFGIIFGFSNQNGEKSGSISEKVTKWTIDTNPFTKNLSDEEKQIKVEKMHTVVRKLAHFSIYTVVGILLMSLCMTYRLKMKNRFLISLIIGFTYASTDEFHQLFIKGRSGQITDVMIDTSGVIVGILIILIISNIINNIKNVQKKI